MCNRTQAQKQYEQRSKCLTLKTLARRKPKPQAFVIEKAKGIVYPTPRDLITYK